MSDKLIEVKGVKVVRDGRTILDVDQFHVGSSEIVAVVGPNGAGKSTLIKVMGLLLRPDRGEVLFAGEKAIPGREHALRNRLACVFQSPHLLDRSVRANVELGLKLRKVAKNERSERAERWIEALGLSKLAERRALTLSGGEAQRVNLARALALKPEVLLLDEPLGGLDAPTRHSFMDELGPLVRSGAGAGLLVTHDRRVALFLGDRVAVMIGGQARQIGPPEDVFARPADEDVARFLGVENLIPAQADGKSVSLSRDCALERSAGPDGNVVVCLRAEEVRLDRGWEKNGDFNTVGGKITKVMRRGVGYAFEVDIGAKLTGRLTRAELGAFELEPGRNVTVHIRPSAVHCIKRAE